MDGKVLSGTEQKLAAFRKIHREFKELMDNLKCRSCACFHGDVMNRAYEKISRFHQPEHDPEIREIQRDFESWIRAADPLDMHG